MKKGLILAGLLCAACMSTNAQENKPFVTADISTQATSRVFHGVGVSLGVGYNLKGLDMGLSLDHYSDGWGHDGISSIAYMDNGTSTTLGSVLTVKGHESDFTLRLRLAYDPLRFIKGNWRHHLRPTLGLGYSQKRTSSFSDQVTAGTWILQCNGQVESGFELSLGIGYDFNITHNWAIGAFFEEYMLVRERDIMGLRARYSF